MQIVFTVNVIVPSGLTTTGCNWTELMSYPIPRPTADWKGSGIMVTLLANCHTEQVQVSDLDRFSESPGWFGDNNVMNSKIVGDVTFMNVSGGSVLRSQCSPTYVYNIELYNGSKQDVGKFIAYPQILSIHEAVEGPYKEGDYNRWSDSYDVDGVWVNTDTMFITWTWTRVVVRVKDNTVIENTVRKGVRYYQYDRRWDTWYSGTSLDKLSSAASFRMAIMPTKFKFIGSLADFLVGNWPWRYLNQQRLGDLAQQACDAFKTNDVNMISYCKELPGLPQLAISTIKSLADLDNPKSWADLFLSTKYGWIMSYKDTKSLIQQAEADLLQRSLQQTVARSKLAFVVKDIGYRWDCEARMKIKLGNSATSPLSQLRKLINSGFWPTAANLWDLVPYSFVVNWLTGVQNVINAIDSNIYADTLPVKSCCFSLKSKCFFDGNYLGMGYYGRLCSTFYQRAVRRSIPYVPLSLADYALDKHIVESAALVIQHVLK